MSSTKIPWTNMTWNPVIGCTKISLGCTNCYAARLASGRLKNHPRYKGLAVNGTWGIERPRCHPELLAEPLHWRKPRMVFVCSMSDLFHKGVPDAFRDEVVARAWLARQHTYQFLTKRHHEMAAYFANGCPKGVLDCIAAAVDPKSTGAGDVQAERAASSWPWPNVWLGVSTEDQQRANERIPILLQIPAAVHYVSLEPLLEEVDMASYLPLATALGIEADGREWGPVYTKSSESYRKYLDWVIVGGETGPGARPMHPDWVRSIKDQCVAAGVPFFLKHNGEWAPAESRDFGRYPEQVVGTQLMHRVGKKHSGRHLDGRIWNEFPAATVRQP